MGLIKILVVEDDESILLLEKKILEDAGYVVDCAASGDRALEMLRSNLYAVVVADVMMPGMDGIDLTKEVFKIYRRQVPVLLVTAMNDALKTAHNRDAKPMSTLQKPFTPQALLTAVRLLQTQSKQGQTVAKASNEGAPPWASDTKTGIRPPSGGQKAPQKPLPSGSQQKKRGWLEKLLHPTDEK